MAARRAARLLAGGTAGLSAAAGGPRASLCALGSVWGRSLASAVELDVMAAFEAKIPAEQVSEGISSRVRR